MINVTTSPEIDVIMEESWISEEIIKKYNLTRKQYSETIDTEGIHHRKSTFVGLVIIANRILASLPKHYMNIDVFNKLAVQKKLAHLKLITRVILAYTWSNQYTQSNDQKYIGSSFPFDAFFNIYKFFKQHGLYYHEIKVTHKGYNGHISWKDTITKSTKLINNGNLIFLPFYLKNTEYESDFITNCMIFVINYTTSTYGSLIGLSKISSLSSKGINYSLLKDREGVVCKLKKIFFKTFKDSQKELIFNLIRFFQNINYQDKKRFSLCHYSFNLIWEAVVGEYLNNYFIEVDEEKDNNSISGHLLFSNTLLYGHRFSKLKRQYYDLANHSHYIEPDHYYLSGNKQYIFDSKYYDDLKQIDYKQIGYYFFLKNRAKNTYNALITPTEGKSGTEIGFYLNPTYSPFKKPVVLYVYRLNEIRALKCFVSKK